MKTCKHGHTIGYDKHGNCIECNRIRCKKHHAQRREQMAADARRVHANRYGKDPVYTARVKAQVRAYSHKKKGIPEPTRPAPVICECCGKAPKKMSLNVDHDHQTGAFRGWLCSGCNRGLGMLGDTLDAVERIRAYLLRAQFT